MRKCSAAVRALAICLLAAAALLPLRARLLASVSGRNGAQALTQPEVTALLARARMTSDPEALDGMTLQANESWTPYRSGDAVPTGATYSETDKVEFYHAVAIEVQTTQDGHPLSASAEARAQALANQVRHAIDRAWRGPQDSGQLVVIEDQVWRISQIEAEYAWSGREGPTVNGDPTDYLDFTPLAGRVAHSREEHLLLSTAGAIQVDTVDGQVLGGTFTSLHPVSFGAGLLARFSAYSGQFTMQPVGPCWALHTLDARMRGRELFHFLNGEESVTYTQPAGNLGLKPY